MTEQEFYEKVPEWIAQEKERWNHITLLAYFCHKYEQKHGIKFRLVRSRKGPTMGKEAADFAKLFRLFSPDNYSDLSSKEKAVIRLKVSKKIYNFINWMFDYKFRGDIDSVNGTRVFHVPAIINHFERMYNLHLKKEENKVTIDGLVSWCKENVPDLLEEHQLNRPEDLKMIQRYYESYSLTADSPEGVLLGKAKEMGLV